MEHYALKPPILVFLVFIFGSACQSHKIIQLNDDSSWCWFQDDRAIIDGDQLIFSGVTSAGANRVTSYHFVTGHVQNFTLNQKPLPPDDHNVGVLLVRPDGRYLTVYAGHEMDSWMRYRVSVHPGDITQWEPEKLVDAGAR